MSAMDDEFLILLVEEYKELYDPSHNLYMNNVRRNQCWEEIAEKMKSSGKRTTFYL